MNRNQIIPSPQGTSNGNKKVMMMMMMMMTTVKQKERKKEKENKRRCYSGEQGEMESHSTLYLSTNSYLGVHPPIFYCEGVTVLNWARFLIISLFDSLGAPCGSK